MRKSLSSVDTVQDLTASILDRVSHITISADSWTMESSAVAEVSFTEEEESILQDSESPPTVFVQCSLIASPLRSVNKRRLALALAPPTPLRTNNSCPFIMTPSDGTVNSNNNSNSNSNNMLPHLGPRNKKRRHAAPPLPSSPIADLTARIAHDPIFSPFSRYEARLDRFATQSTTTDQKDDFIHPPGPTTSTTSTTTSTIDNPFATSNTAQPSTWIMTTPPSSAKRRRRRLHLRTTHFPSFPCFSSPMHHPMQSPTLHCSPISKPTYS